jgi:anti-sigma regulatory factor (Ser/Thr protein kinase)
VAIVAQRPPDTSGARRAYPPIPASARSAREQVRETLLLHDVDPAVAQVLVSELTVNAIRHARTDFDVRIDLTGDVVHVEVEDGELPVDPDAWCSGDRPAYGLRIVDGLAAGWGVEPTPGGKVVWFDLAATPAR